MKSDRSGERRGFRESIARTFTGVEDVVYVALAVLLTAVLLTLLTDAAMSFVRALGDGLSGLNIIPFLDRALLVLMVVEILYTVQVSFREHPDKAIILIYHHQVTYF